MTSSLVEVFRTRACTLQKTTILQILNQTKVHIFGLNMVLLFLCWVYPASENLKIQQKVSSYLLLKTQTINSNYNLSTKFTTKIDSITTIIFLFSRPCRQAWGTSPEKETDVEEFNVASIWYNLKCKSLPIESENQSCRQLCLQPVKAKLINWCWVQLHELNLFDDFQGSSSIGLAKPHDLERLG